MPQPIAPAPVNGAQSVPTPATNGTTSPAQPPASGDQSSTDLKAKYAQLEETHQKKVREQIVERRKWDSEKKGFGEKLKAADEYEKMKRMAKANPQAFLKHWYGDDAPNALMAVQANGGQPTPEMLQYELERVREETRAEFQKELEARDAKAKEAQSAATQQREQQARQQLRREAAAFWKDSGKDYPALEHYGDANAIADIIADRIESEWRKSIQRDDAGNVVSAGNVLTAKEVADKVEAEILSHAEKVFAAEKYKQKWQTQTATPQPVKPQQSLSGVAQQSGKQQPRRTLTNDLTGSTPGRQPATTEEERQARAKAAFLAARSQHA